MRRYRSRSTKAGVDLLHHLTLGPDREPDLDPVGPDYSLQCDREAAKTNKDIVEFLIETGEHVSHDLQDLAQRVLRRDPVLKIEIA